MAEAFIELHACGKHPYYYTYSFYSYLPLPVFTDLFVFFSYFFIVSFADYYSLSIITTDFVVFFSQFTFIVSYADSKYLHIYPYISKFRVLRREPKDEMAVCRRQEGWSREDRKDKDEARCPKNECVAEPPKDGGGGGESRRTR